MSRNEILKKLGAAIRDYRGIFIPATGKWRKAPNPGALERVQKWLARLGKDETQIAAAITQIDGFKAISEFNTWIQRQ